MSDENESILVRQACEGDFSAFEILFHRYRDAVYRYVYQMVNRRDEAEDIVQEVFVRAYQNLHRYRDEAKFTTWLFRIAANLHTDRVRMAKRRQTLEQQEASGALSWMTIGTQEDPIQNLENENRHLLLRKALSELPEHHKQAIILRDIEEREYEEVAKILNCSLGGAKLRVLRARRALKELVELLQGEVRNEEAVRR